MLTTRSMKNLLDPEPEQPVVEAVKWSKLVPKKINIHAWKVNRGRIGTCDELIRRKINLQVTTCSLCNEAEEYVDHLYTSCSFSNNIWLKIASWCRCDPIYLFQARDIFNLHNNMRMAGNKKKCFHAVLLVAVWSIWNHRNDVVFNRHKPSVNFVFEDIKSNSFIWVKSRNKSRCIAWLDWDSFTV